MSNLMISDLTIEDILPHRGNMLLVSEVVEVDSKTAVTRCRPEPWWPLSGTDGVDPLILVELAAQTAGVCNGWDRIRKQGLDSEKIGWLVGVKKAAFFIDNLPFGISIISRANNTYNFENLREVACEQLIDGRVVGTTTLQLFQEPTK